MQVLVTGAAAYLGRPLVAELATRGHRVTAADVVADLPADTEQVRWRRLDVLDSDQVAAAMAGQEMAFHRAAKITLHHRGAAAWRLNTEGVRTVARAALTARVARFVHCSSVHSSAPPPVAQAGGPSQARLTTAREVIDQIGPLSSDLIAQPEFAGEVEGALADLRGSINAEALPETALRLAPNRLGQDCDTVCGECGR